jgi:SAF domain
MTTTGTVETERPRKGSSKTKSNGTKAGPVQSRVRNRPRPMIIALSVALIIAASLAASYIYTTTGRTTAVFSAATPIARGDIIESADLTTVEIPDNQQIPSYATTDADSVIGKTATVDIPDGTLISPNNIARQAGLPANTSIVGISLTPSQLPAYPMSSGDPVRIVETPVNQGDPPATTPKTISATVASVTKDDVSGNTVVSVQVNSGDAADLAARAATGRVALILDSEQE